MGRYPILTFNSAIVLLIFPLSNTYHDLLDNPKFL